MQASLRLGRIGPLTIHLNYTWLFAAVLILWWIALLWLPDRYPDWARSSYWLVALAVLFLFVLCVIAHELVHTLIAGSEPRMAYLYPFGAAVPFRLGRLDPGRVVYSAVGGILFNAALGVLFLFLGGALPDEGFLGALGPMFTLLGWLNLIFSAVNLIPGIPLDGGWAVAGGAQWITNEYEAGLRFTQWVGSATGLILVLAGAWRGLTSNAWLQALGLVVLGWAVTEASAIGRQRSLVRGMMDQLRVRDFMEEMRADDIVMADANVAQMAATHNNYPPNKPLAVLRADGSLEGVTYISETDNLLQGTWPSTPVHAVSTSMDQVKTLSPNDSITAALALTAAEEAEADGKEETAANKSGLHIPVLDGRRMVGTLDPGLLSAFDTAGRQFGLDEMGVARGDNLLRRLASFLPVLLILAAAAIVGNIALRTDPDRLRDVVPEEDAEVLFANFNPAGSQIIGLGEREISVQVSANRPIISATLIVDGTRLETQLSGASPLTQTATALMPGLTQGLHNAQVSVLLEGNEPARDSWNFRVDPAAAEEPDETPEPTQVVAQPTQTAVPRQPLTFVRYSPSSAGRVPAGQANVTLSAIVRGPSAPVSATISLDGRPLEATVQPMAGVEDAYRVISNAGDLATGEHRVRVDVAGEGGGFYSSEWTFTALSTETGNAEYFRQTGFFVSGPFLEYWRDNGGLGLFGYPISDEILETVQATGEVYRAQYFERARFELHEGTRNEVVLGRLGALVQQPEAAAQPVEGARFFPETGHNLSGPFLAYWEANGGLAVFGFPITEERVEKNPADGKEYTVQYFERNRFELHPERAGTPFEVQLGLLGRQLYDRLYGVR